MNLLNLMEIEQFCQLQISICCLINYCNYDFDAFAFIVIVREYQIYLYHLYKMLRFYAISYIESEHFRRINNHTIDQPLSAYKQGLVTFCFTADWLAF